MDITEHRSGDILNLHVSGRLDSYWAEPLERRLEEVIREGAHRLHLDLSEVVYLSSAGIRVLIKFHRQLRNIQGSFAIIQSSAQVKSVLELAGLHTLFVAAPPAQPEPLSSAAATTKTLEHEHATFEVFTQTLGATLTCQTIGKPELLMGSRFTATESRSVSFPDQTFAVGLGAFGGNFAECQDRFGNFWPLPVRRPTFLPMAVMFPIICSRPALSFPRSKSSTPSFAADNSRILPDLKTKKRRAPSPSPTWSQPVSTSLRLIL